MDTGFVLPQDKCMCLGTLANNSVPHWMLLLAMNSAEVDAGYSIDQVKALLKSNSQLTIDNVRVLLIFCCLSLI